MKNFNYLIIYELSFESTFKIELNFTAYRQLAQ